MSKKDFIALADAIRYHNANLAADDQPFDAEQLDVLSDFCQSQNNRFLRDRWLDYIAGECGPGGRAIKKAS